MNLKTKIVGSALILGVIGTQVAPAAAACLFGRDSVTQTFVCSLAQHGVSLQATANQQAIFTTIQRAVRTDHSGFDRNGVRCQHIINGTGNFRKACPNFLEKHSLVSR